MNTGHTRLLHVHLSEVALIFVRIQQRLDKGSLDIGWEHQGIIHAEEGSRVQRARPKTERGVIFFPGWLPIPLLEREFLSPLHPTWSMPILTFVVTRGWRYSIWLDRQPNKVSYARKKTLLEGELLSRDCLKRLLVLKELCNLMKVRASRGGLGDATQGAGTTILPQISHT